MRQCAKCGANITRQTIPFLGHYLCDQCFIQPKVLDSEEATLFDKNGIKKVIQLNVDLLRE